MYMRLVGWPAERISILTTYNGQKHLIRDVVDKRCAANPLIGRPHKVPLSHILISLSYIYVPVNRLQCISAKTQV